MPNCDHVALVCSALEPAVELLAGCGLPVGPIEEFPGEGTREVYVGAEGAAGRLLLMQPLGAEGPYARALGKRGPGLHHVAYRVPDAVGGVSSLSGWLLVPRSLSSYAECRTLWLARPGVGALVELAEGSGEGAGPPLVEAVEVVAQDAALAGRLFEPLQGATRLVPVEGRPQLTVGGRRLSVRDLARPSGC